MRARLPEREYVPLGLRDPESIRVPFHVLHDCAEGIVVQRDGSATSGVRLALACRNDPGDQIQPVHLQRTDFLIQPATGTSLRLRTLNHFDAGAITILGNGIP
jgi:hypothetical protein